MNELRAEAAKLIRQWWTKTPPPKGWHMGRELSIWKRLVRLDSPEIVNGAMTMLPMMAPNLEPSLKYFYGPNCGPLYERCKAAYLKGRPTTESDDWADREIERFRAKRTDGPQAIADVLKAM